MKKIAFLLSAIAVLILFCVTCEPIDDRPECEKNNTGSYKVINGAALILYAQIYSDKGGWTEKVLIHQGNSYTFHNVPAGDVELWEEDLASPWGYWDEYVRQCSETSTTIYNKKCADKNFSPIEAVE
jgi:hypothetical protein